MPVSFQLKCRQVHGRQTRAANSMAFALKFGIGLCCAVLGATRGVASYWWGRLPISHANVFVRNVFLVRIGRAYLKNWGKFEEALVSECGKLLAVVSKFSSISPEKDLYRKYKK